MRDNITKKCGWLWIHEMGYPRLPRGIHGTIHGQGGYDACHPQPSTISQQQMPTMWMMARRPLKWLPTRSPPAIHRISRLSTQLSTGSVAMGGVVGRVRRGPTYAHKGRVVHIFRPVIHAGNECSSALESRPVGEIRWKNKGLHSIAYLSTINVDNSATCG